MLINVKGIIHFFVDVLVSYKYNQQILNMKVKPLFLIEVYNHRQ